MIVSTTFRSVAAVLALTLSGGAIGTAQAAHSLDGGHGVRAVSTEVASGQHRRRHGRHGVRPVASPTVVGAHHGRHRGQKDILEVTGTPTVDTGEDISAPSTGSMTPEARHGNQSNDNSVSDNKTPGGTTTPDAQKEGETETAATSHDATGTPQAETEHHGVPATPTVVATGTVAPGATVVLPLATSTISDSGRGGSGRR